MNISQLADKWREEGKRNASESNAEWLYKCAAELEAESEEWGLDLQYMNDLKIINERMEAALRKIAYEIPLDVSGDEAATMCEEIAAEFFQEEP